MASEDVRAGRLTRWGWWHLAIMIMALVAAARFFATGYPLGVVACLVSAYVNGSFIYTGWKNDKA